MEHLYEIPKEREREREILNDREEELLYYMFVPLCYLILYELTSY